jgi:hypothetical protein
LKLNVDAAVIESTGQGRLDWDQSLENKAVQKRKALGSREYEKTVLRGKGVKIKRVNLYGFTDA